MTVLWSKTYLNVHLNDPTVIELTKNTKPLSKDEECFAMGFKKVLPADIVLYKQGKKTEQLIVSAVKYAQPIFYKSIFKARRRKKVQIKWNHKPGADALIPKWVNVLDEDIYCVLKIIPTINTIPWLLIKQDCLMNENETLTRLSQQSQNRYSYDYNDHVVEEEANPSQSSSASASQSSSQSSSPKPNKSIQGNIPEPTDSPTPSQSSSASTSQSSSASDLSQQHRMDRFLSKEYTHNTKLYRRSQRTNRIIKQTRIKAKQVTKVEHKTPILYSTKYEFCLRLDHPLHKFGKSVKRVWTGMKKEGFEVGKSYHAASKWRNKGAEYYKKLIQKKGRDGYKFSLCFLHHMYFLKSVFKKNHKFIIYTGIKTGDVLMLVMKRNFVQRS